MTINFLDFSQAYSLALDMSLAIDFSLYFLVYPNVRHCIDV